ncbi:TIGR03620 family F420-dependent LLM class oxidoreductase [Kribbella sp. NPDC056861]|uniref:TIGR03620 family F420-dependent LLM class oxidoreductase n=1 Tax=Kribbella sp. NPDC056861 TaxID=3154857 RepID=UPI00341B69E1
MTSPDFGPFGITTGLTSSPESLAAARAAEDLGYPAIWLSGGPLPGLQTITDLIEATTTIKFISGILAVDTYSAADVTATYAALAASAPGRFTVGLGGAHGPKPLATLNSYLDQLDGVPAPDAPAGHPLAEVPAERPRPGVPTEHRLLAALGPRMLDLARDRTSGAYPFLITPDYTAEARRTLGPDKLLAVAHLVVLETDPDRARAIARDTISFFPQIPGYAASLKRQGFTDKDLATLPNHLVDSLAAWGTPTEIAAKLHQHHEAGANHVAVNVITGVTGPQPINEWRALAPALLT